MTFTNYLKLQLDDFVDSYKKFYSSSLDITLIFTLITFLLTSLLLHFSIFNKYSYRMQHSLLSYFFERFSIYSTYSIVDLSKTAFIFMVSIFSISQTRLKQEDVGTNKNRVSRYFEILKAEDFTYLVVALAISVVADYILFFADDTLMGSDVKRPPYYQWVHGILFQLRIYIPLMVFSFANFKALNLGKLKMNFKKLFFLFVSLWLFNEFANELSAFAVQHVFGLVLLPFSNDKHFFIESILAVPLISFYFLGYHSAMTNSMLLLNDEDTGEVSESDNTELDLSSET